MSLEYRDKSLRKLKIHLEATSPFKAAATQFRVIFELPNGHHSFKLVVEYPGEYFWQSTGTKPPESFEKILLDFAKCFVLDRSFLRHNTDLQSQLDKRVLISNVEAERKAVIDSRFSWAVNDIGELRVAHPLIERLTIEEGRLARRIALDTLYRHASISMSEILHLAHFPREIMEREVNSLNASKLVAHNLEQGVSFLTTEGREYFESDPWIGTNNVFVIAACHANNNEDEASHQTVLDAYKDYFKRSDSIYNPIFQEHEEPEKNIYVDIFNYIDECAFIIADITYDRPNCYVEIGYALARGKHVIGYMQKEYFDEKAKETGGSKIPFDLFPIKFFEYSKHNLDDLKKSLEERVGVIKRRHGN